MLGIILVGMNLIYTIEHAKYFAHDLTRQATRGMNRLPISLFDAAVDLNPHQIDAALFALQSPLSKRDALIESLERRLAQHSVTEALFAINWGVTYHHIAKGRARGFQLDVVYHCNQPDHKLTIGRHAR